MKYTKVMVCVLGTVFATAGLWACSDDSGNGEDVDAGPDAQIQFPVIQAQCPGDPDCADQGDNTLYVGVSIVDITPQDLKEGPSLVDVNGDGLYNSEDGDTFTDTDEDMKMDAIWIAGFDASRPAMDVHDPIEGRILAMRYNNTTVVWVFLDLIGFFLDYQLEVAARLDPAVRDQIDLVLASSTHTHQGPDTIGIWGRKLNESGLDLEYLDWVFDRLAQGITESLQDLEEANATFGAIQVEDATGNNDAYMRDGRDPTIIDKTMNVMRLFRPSNDETIATVIEFASHPEFVGSENNLLSADYVYFLREAVETGDTTGIQGIGGVCMYASGALGGQIGPHNVIAIDRAGNPVCEDCWESAEAVGQSYAEFALRALEPANGAVTVTDVPISFRTRRVFTRIDNFLYQAAWRLGIFNRSLYNFNPEGYIEEGNIPEIITELVYMRIGPAGFITIPGELHPELFIGCYDGSCAGSQEFIDPNNPAPPPVANAPQGPYLRDLMITNGDQFQWCLGLTQDELGYIMPDYNYVLDPGSPYMEEAEGDHYEETNSLGPYARGEIIDPLVELITWDGQ